MPNKSKSTKLPPFKQAWGTDDGDVAIHSKKKSKSNSKSKSKIKSKSSKKRSFGA